MGLYTDLTFVAEILSFDKNPMFPMATNLDGLK